jgi:hypothetical protein
MLKMFPRKNIYLNGYNWDEAPGMDLEHVYQPPILNDKPELAQADESDSDLVQYDSVQSDLVERDGHGSDSEEYE